MVTIEKYSLDNLDFIVKEVTNILQNPGAVILVPTETVYGLIAKADDPIAKERIYQLKKREENKRLGWFVPNWEKVDKYGIMLNDIGKNLAKKYFPGPLTLIAPKDDGSTQSIRIPNHPLLLAILQEIDCPLWQTSANASGFPDAKNVNDAISMLDGEVDLAIDGGPLEKNSSSSTIISVVDSTPKILRQGNLVVEI
jgi:L-threonylcarbamoyladenylate synthase